MNLSNKRQFTRTVTNFPVTVEFDCGSNKKWVAQALNISVGGILLWLSRPLPMNVPLVIHFPSKQPMCFALVKILRRNEHFYGCEFIGLPPKGIDFMDSAIDNYKHHYTPKHVNTLYRQE